MPVDSQHSQYEASVSKWKMVRDCVAGAKAIRDAGKLYLPDPNPNADDAVARYKAYLARAIFTNVIKPTNDAMVGMGFRKDPIAEIPAQLEYIEANATGDGVTLEQVGKNTVASLLQAGRYGLLSDYPSTDANLSDAEVRALNLQSHIKCYPPESIINWQTSTVNGKEVLSLVVLKEDYAVAEDQFKSVSNPQYRVLKLIDGVYAVEVWRDDEIVSYVEPRVATGERLTFIPFIIAGAYDNAPSVDDAALYDIAEINLGHYRNSADKEEGLFLHGQPMLHLDIGDMNHAQWIEANPKGVQVGARRGLITSGGGTATLLQTQANDAVSQEMISKREEMVAIGARLIEQGGQAETATAAILRYASTNSVLSNVVQNASSALTVALNWCGLFMGANSEASYSINEDFYDKGLDAAQVMAGVQLFDRGILAKADLRANARKTGMIDADRSDDDIDSDVGDTSPLE